MADRRRGSPGVRYVAAVGKHAVATGPECGRCRVLGISLLLRLLENQGGARLQERGKRHLVGKERMEVAVLLVEAA
jgi:hypothetical protein